MGAEMGDIKNQSLGNKTMKKKSVILDIFIHHPIRPGAYFKIIWIFVFSKKIK
jgi:hypothetical protein